MTHPMRVALDFDGVLHPMQTPWTGPLDIHDPPYPGAIEWCRALLEEGWVVVLHTCRLMHSVPPEETQVPEVDLDARLEALRAWFVEHGGADVVEHPSWRWWTHGGKPWADLYVDDKAVRVGGGCFPGPRLLRLNGADAATVAPVTP